MEVLLLLMIALSQTHGAVATRDCPKAIRAVLSELQPLRTRLFWRGGDMLKRYDGAMATLRHLETQACDATQALPTLTGPDLNITQAAVYYGPLVALPGGEALMVVNKKRVVRLDRQGRVVPPAFHCRIPEYRILGLMVDGDDVYVLQLGGNITTTQLSNLNHTSAEWRVPGVWRIRPGALLGTELYMVDYNRRMAFSLNWESKEKTIWKTGLALPVNIASAKTDNATSHFIVAEYGGHRISIFNATWNLISTIGGQRGSRDGQLDRPYQVLVTPWSTFLVTDMENHRVTEFSLSGRFLRHLLTSRDGINRPAYISYSRPYLWLIHYTRGGGPYTVKRYQLV